MRNKLRFALLLGGLLFPAASIFGFTEPVQTSQTHVYTTSGGHSYLGVDIADITSDRVGPLKLREERGVEVTMVDQDAPAGKAGLKEHDVILEFNGSRVESGEQLRRFIRETPPGRTVTLGISRDGSSMNIKVELVDRSKVMKDSMSHVWTVKPTPMPPMPPMPRVTIPTVDFQWNMYSPYLGVQVESIGRQLGEYFGIKDGEGILIKSVEKNSPAEKAGLKAGDVIVRADNERVSDRSDLRRILANHRKGGKVAIGVMRDRREQTITVDIPEHQSKESSGIYLDFDGMSGSIEELRDWVKEMKELGPEIRNRVIKEVQPQVRIALEKSQQVKAQVKTTVKQAEKELQRMKVQVRRGDWI
jgi:membrane-associated protease RseP (regulator of RpoE activity)